MRSVPLMAPYSRMSTRLSPSSTCRGTRRVTGKSTSRYAGLCAMRTLPTTVAGGGVPGGSNNTSPLGTHASRAEPRRTRSSPPRCPVSVSSVPLGQKKWDVVPGAGRATTTMSVWPGGPGSCAIPTGGRAGSTIARFSGSGARAVSLPRTSSMRAGGPSPPRRRVVVPSAATPASA